MSKIPLRNERCPCGSGKKFKKCCRVKSVWRKPEAVHPAAVLALATVRSLGRLRR